MTGIVLAAGLVVGPWSFVRTATAVAAAAAAVVAAAEGPAG